MMAWLAKTDEKSAILCQVGTQETDQELFYHLMFEEETKYRMHLEKISILNTGIWASSLDMTNCRRVL
jgi:hypothetical protein